MTLRDLLRRLRALAAPGRIERELDDELAFHIEREAHKHITAGLEPAAAIARARARFGSVPLAADQCRDARGTGAIASLARDVRDAFRAFRRAPLVALTIVATIALGLALVTVAFTVYNALFLRVDAVRNPDELFTVERLTRPDLPHGPGSDRAWTPFTRREFDLLRHDTGVLTDAVAMLPDVATRIDGRAMSATLVSGNFFEMLGAHAAFGRALIPADDDRVTAQQVLVLSYRGWTRLFAGDRTVVGRDVRVNGLPCEVVGVMPENFRGLSVAPPDFWLPLALAGQFHMPFYAPAYEGNAYDEMAAEFVIGRLKSGIRPETAEAALTAWASGRSDIRRDFPGRPNQLTLTPNHGTLWPETFRGLIAPIVFAFSLVLMIGCANVANLLLARGVARQTEIGIRLSLGASRWRIVRQLFMENLVLALVAAACGIVLSRWLLTGGLYAASAAMPPQVAEQMSIAPLPVDWRVLLFLIAVAIGSTVLFGLAPAVRATRIEFVRAIRGELTKVAKRGRSRQTLIALQVGAATFLLIASTVFLRSAFAAATVPFGFRTSDTLIVPVTHERLRAGMLDQVTTHPSVASVAASSSAGMAGWPVNADAVTFQRASSAGASGTPTGTTTAIGYGFVSSGYFDVLGIDVLKGRHFAAAERTTDAGVVVVSAQGARRLWPGRDAVGQVIRFTAVDPSSPQQPNVPRAPSRPYTVVGVVRDIGADLGGGVSQFANPDVYLPASLESPGTSLVLRVQGDPDEARRALLDRLLGVDPALGDIRTLRGMVEGRAFVVWIVFGVTVVLAGLALALTVSGLFSVLSYTVEQRKKEIGVRLALGATTRDVARWVLAQMFGPVGLGLVAGTGLVTVLVKVLVTWVPFWLGNVVTVFDPLTYAAALVLIVIACALAASIPAARATRIDPIATLRQD